jgi:DNA-binding NtrC family response regulator
MNTTAESGRRTGADVGADEGATKGRVLLVDDDATPRTAIRRFLKIKGFDVCEAGDCASAKEQIRESRPDLCVSDHMLPDGTALDLLPWFQSHAPDMPVIVLTGHGTIDLAVEAVKAGAEQFLTKPVDLETLTFIVQRTLESSRARRRHQADQKSRANEPVNPFLGESDAIRQLEANAVRVARSDSPVLIEGETGTGKTLLARWLHHASRRGREPFVDLNCGGLTREFLESELFGHEKGAFTGAVTPKQGLLEIAHRGTIFLDEIGDMDPQVQPKVLKVLEEKRFRRMGAVRDMSVDVRLVAATHLDLGTLCNEGKFRSDLYYRVSALPLRVPSLRERPGDIPVLARHFLEILSRDLRSPQRSLSPAAESALVAYPFPGNIRELRNILERALIHSDHQTIDARDLHLEGRATASANATRFQGTLDEAEKFYIEQVLGEEAGRVESAAERLGLTRSTMYYKIRKHGIEIPRGR